jgi:predicted O-linked N-acetylglucosamine transferase (SPINDLY family)
MPSPQVIRAMQQAVQLHQAGRFDDAERVYRQVLHHDPRDVDALHLLGVLSHQRGRDTEAVELIHRAVTIQPKPEFLVNLSNSYRALGESAKAVEAGRRAVQMAPQIPEAWNNYAMALKDARRLPEVVDALNRAVQLRPNYAVALSNLGNALAELRRPAEAEATLRRAIAADPRYPNGYINLANLLSDLGRYDEAIELCNRAIALGATGPAVHMNLGVALHSEGRFEEGNAAFARGAQLYPNHAKLAENLIAGASYTTRISPQQAREAHVQWARTFAEGAVPPAVHTNSRDTNRRLRIGYVSPDLKRHSVAYFLEPILEHHDRSRFEITAYSNTTAPDEVTDRLRARCDGWRDIITMNDDEVAEQVRTDGIDILVDLAGHTTGNRLGVFGRKPAPVQMTYLGYPNTTGLSAIDYRITDAFCDPPGMTELFHSERLLRLDPPFICYRPPENAPPVVEPPLIRNGYVTFGSFNKIAKAGPEAIELWAGVMNAVPGSRLVLKSQGLGTQGSRRRLIEGFAQYGVAADRLELIEANQGLPEHLAVYGRIDVALDTFPYHGTTTTCEALWMGVPTVSLVGQTHVSRVGLSLLTAVGRPEWTVSSPRAFALAVRGLISDRTALSSDRLQLRERVRNSPLCNAQRLVKTLEDSVSDVFAAWAADKRNF